MAKTDFKSVADYIAAQPPAAGSVLVKVRRVMKKALPGAEEVISYRMPAYKLGGRAAIYFAGYREHFSIYPATGAVLRALGDAAKKHLASKATLRFALDEPVPVRLIERVAKVRAQELAERVVSRTKKAKPTTTAKAEVRTKRTAKVQPAALKSQVKGRPKPKRNTR